MKPCTAQGAGAAKEDLGFNGGSSENNQTIFYTSAPYKTKKMGVGKNFKIYLKWKR